LLFTIFAFALTLGLVVIVHELGHFLFCKLFGVYVKTFSLGIGPKLLRKRFGETEYVLSLIPFGGYVKMAGEGLMEEIQDTGTWEERKYPLGTEEGNREAAELDLHIPESRHLNNRPAWQRLLVFIAGPLFNLLLAFLVYAGIVLQGGMWEVPFTRVGALSADSPAATAGFEVGDQILSVDGLPVTVWEEIMNGIVTPSIDAANTPQPVTVEISRDGLNQQLTIVPDFLPDQQRWLVGIEPWDTTIGLVQRGGPAAELGLREGDVILALNDEPVTSFGAIARIINQSGGQQVLVRWQRDGEILEGVVVPEMAEVAPDSMVGRIFIDRQYVNRDVSFVDALVFGAERTVMTVQATLDVLYRFVAGRLGLQAVGGPIRIGQVAGEMLRWSFAHLMAFIAFFSVNLFLLNLLPIPVLDGGHVLFLIVEVVIRRRVPERFQAIATQVGLIILMLFMTFVVVVDVWKVTGH